jgi:HK97 family phage prohead protease
METLYIEASSIECIEERREISGKIVPMGTGEIGNTNLGGVVFQAGSIQIEDPSKIRLLSQHDIKKPVGRMVSAEVREGDGIYATFKLSRSTGGNDALVMAQEGLVTGLSVGAEIIASAPSKSGHTVVTSARLKEVSLVTEAAFKSAAITEIRAEEISEVEETKPTESEAVVENTPDTVAAPEVEATAVEAARPTVSAPAYAKERTAPISSTQYLEASIKAALGDDDSRRVVRAADDSTSTNTGLTLPQHLNQFVTDTFSGRPAFDAVTRNALIDSGMSFTVPRLYTNATSADTAPAVADVNEGASVTDTGMTSAYDTVNINKFAGLNRISWELIDRSSPSFMELLMAELRKAYEKATDSALLTELISSGTTAATTAATAAGLQSFISVEGAAAYKGTGGDFANKLVVNTDQWAAITGYADTTGRALYSAQGPTMNASGTAVASSVRGNILGTDLIVDHNIAASGVVDNSAFLIAPSSVYVWESPVTNLRLQVLTTGELEIALYGYMAVYVAKSGKGVRKFNLT